MQKVRIGLVSDVACPWCAIGYRRLELALETLEGEIDVELVWQPFELNPDMPPEGERFWSTCAASTARMLPAWSSPSARLWRWPRSLD